jgi:hypothetical protein
MNEQSLLEVAATHGALLLPECEPEPEEACDQRFEIALASPAINRERLLALRELLRGQHGDTPVRLLVEVPDIGRVVINIGPNYAVSPGPELRRQISALFQLPCAA